MKKSIVRKTGEIGSMQSKHGMVLSGSFTCMLSYPAAKVSIVALKKIQTAGAKSAKSLRATTQSSFVTIKRL